MTLLVTKRLIRQRKYLMAVSCLGAATVLMWISLSSIAAVYSPAEMMANSAANIPIAATVPQQFAVDVDKPNRSTSDVRLADCTISQPVHHSLASASSPQLKKLAQYEQVCNSAIVSKMSFFVATPTTAAEAKEYAQRVALQLREFASYDISPLVFFEPTSSIGLVDMQAYRAGAYDTVFDAYFAAIKAQGVTDRMMGIWVPLPEGNLPVWSSVQPDDFAACVTKAASYQKKYFPVSHTSILLDTDTYPVSGSWTNSQAVSLLPYIQGIPTGLIDSVGLQGLPWVSAANEPGESNGLPSEYLRVELLAELAKAMNVTDVWMNTGSFGVKYASQTGRQILVTPEERLSQLHGVITGVKALQAQNFNVSVHLFAEDKSSVPEATDWSYWPNGKAASSPSTIIFKTFVHDLQAADVPLWLFDAE